MLSYMHVAHAKYMLVTIFLLFWFIRLLPHPQLVDRQVSTTWWTISKYLSMRAKESLGFYPRLCYVRRFLVTNTIFPPHPTPTPASTRGPRRAK